MSAGEEGRIRINTPHSSDSGRPSSFMCADKIFKNAGMFGRTIHRLPCKPVDELALVCSRLFDSLDREDPFQRELNSRIWVLKSSIFFTLLPFDSRDLFLQGQANKIKEDSRGIPAIAVHVERLCAIIKHLIEHPENPKRNKIFAILDRAQSDSSRTGIVATLAHGGRSPGWPASIVEELLRHPSRPGIISTRKTLSASVYDQIILPASGRNCSQVLMNDLCNAFRSRNLEIMLYGREYFHLPPTHNLPKGQFLISGTTRDAKKPFDETETTEQDTKIDDWMNSSFWEIIRSSKGLPGGTAVHSDQEAAIRARYVIFADRTGQFLAEDRKIIEISDLLEGRVSLEHSGGRFPKKKISELTEGDLVVLRLSGSGDYLEDVADAEMKKIGRGDLLKQSTSWKEHLEKALLAEGSRQVAGLMEKKGFRLNSGHRYIWVWTTHLVISPENQATFIALMECIDKYLPESDPRAYATKRWELMEELKSYHRKAGQLIRQALLKQVAVLIAEKTEVRDFLRIVLPGVDAGEMGILRVSATDHETVWVPFSRINHRERIEDHLWQG